MKNWVIPPHINMKIPFRIRRTFFRFSCLNQRIFNFNFLFQTLPDQSHCYFLSDHNTLNGYVVKKIPFSHPAQVPRILAILRKQAVFNAILSSCVRTSGIQGEIFWPRVSERSLMWKIWTFEVWWTIGNVDMKNENTYHMKNDTFKRKLKNI